MTSASQPLHYSPIVITLGLTLLTLLLLLAYPKYVIKGENLLANSDFSQNLESWERSGPSKVFSVDQGVARITQTSSSQSARLLQHVRSENLAGSYYLSARLRSQDIVAGKEGWQRGGLIVIRYDAEGRRSGSFPLTSLDGTTAWNEYETFIDLPAPTTHIAIAPRLLDASGELQIDTVNLSPALKQPYFNTLRLAVIICWVVLALSISVWYVQRYKLSTGLFAIVFVAALALAGTLMPKSVVVMLDAKVMEFLPATTSASITSIFDTVLPGYIRFSNQEVSKAGHFLIFLLLTVVALLMSRRLPVYYLLLMLLSLAAVSETLQLLTDGRKPHINDFFIDIAGIAAGILLALPLRVLIAKKTTVST